MVALEIANWVLILTGIPLVALTLWIALRRPRMDIPPGKQDFPTRLHHFHLQARHGRKTG